MKTALIILKAAISAALVWYLSRKVSFAEAASHFSGLRIVPALAAFLLLALSLALSAFRWHHAAGGLVSLPSCLRFTWVGQLYAHVLPGVLSADVAKGVVMTTTNASNSGRALSASIVLDRVAGVGSLVVFGLLSSLARPGWLPVSGGWLVGLALLGTIGLLALPGALARLLPRFAISNRSWIIVLLLSCVIQLVNVTFYHVSLIAVGGRETWWEMGLYTCLLNLAMLLPVSIGGIGLREQIAVSLFQSSANAPVQIAFAWLVLFLSLVHALIGLALHWSGGGRERAAEAAETSGARVLVK